MNVQIDTEKLSSLDLEILRLIDFEREDAIREQLSKIKELEGSVFALKTELAVKEQEIQNIKIR